MSSTSTFLVEIDGQALPDDIAPLLTAAFVDDSQRYPDLFELRFRDPSHLVISKTGVKVGSPARPRDQVDDLERRRAVRLRYLTRHLAPRSGCRRLRS